MNQKALIEKFEGKILGVRNYPHLKNEFFTNDFTNIEKLIAFLDEVDCGESDITPAGKTFLEKYFGFNTLAKMLVEDYKYSQYDRKSPESLEVWLSNLVPMEIMTFVEQARGNIGENFSLREELLPPDLN